jgi:O-antigen/teichoic acid export membrane protein
MLFKHHVTNPAALSIASQLTWGAQGFITFVMAGRLLPRKEFGFVVIANAILFGCQCLLLGPVTNPTLRFGAISRKSLRITYLMYCAVTALVCSGFLLGSSQIGRLIDNDPTFVTLIKYLSIPFATICLYAVQKIVLFARMRYKTVLMMDILFTTTNVTGLLLLHLNGLLTSAVWFYIARSGAAVVGLVPALLLYVLSRSKPTLEDDQPFDLREYFQHSKYSSISMFSSYGQSQVDVLAVAHFLSPLSAAVYGAAKVFYTGMTMVTSGLLMVVMPASSRIVASGAEGLRSYYRRTLLLAYALLLPGAVVLAVFAGSILHLCFGGRYADAVPIVRIFCIAALILPVSSVTDAVANGAGWFRSACAAAVAGGVLGVAVSLYLPRVIGIAGAALAPIVGLAGTAFVIASLTWGSLMARNSSPPVQIQTVTAAAQAREV